MMFFRAAFPLAMLAWTGLTLAAGTPQRQLVVLGAETKEVRACLPLQEGETFYLEFVNSVYLAPVRESLVYSGGEGIYAVGVESPSAGVFEYYGIEPDGSGRASLHRKVGEIKLRSMSYENHRLSAGGRILRLKDIAAPGEPLVVEVREGICRH
jgi:hypothetical protein